MFEIAQEEIQVENVYQKRLILKNKHFKFGKGGLFCPPQINDSIQAVVQYLYQSILFMNEGTLQLTITTKTN